MCAHRWAEINFTKVSSLCLDRHKRVFLNEGKDSARDNLDRLACRERKVEGVRNTFLSICVVAAEREIVTSDNLFVVAGEFQPGDESARMLPGARRFQGAQQPAQGQVYLILKLLVCEALSY
jgi:hypothetical protein